MDVAGALEEILGAIRGAVHGAPTKAQLGMSGIRGFRSLAAGVLFRFGMPEVTLSAGLPSWCH